MADATKYSSNGINVEPTSSFLHIRIEDVDCSSTTNCSVAPIDGQFLAAPGLEAHDGFNTDAATTNADYLGGGVATLDMVRGPTLAMVWLSRFRTDLAALGNARVPVVRGALRFKTKLFNLAHGEDISTVYAPGTQLTVQAAFTAVDSSAERLVLDNAASIGAAASGWVVGYVTRVISTLAGSEEIEVQLYDQPRLITEAKD